MCGMQLADQKPYYRVCIRPAYLCARITEAHVKMSIKRLATTDKVRI